jgi:hypothetical protein
MCQQTTNSVVPTGTETHLNGYPANLSISLGPRYWDKVVRKFEEIIKLDTGEKLWILGGKLWELLQWVLFLSFAKIPSCYYENL